MGPVLALFSHSLYYEVVKHADDQWLMSHVPPGMEIQGINNNYNNTYYNLTSTIF